MNKLFFAILLFAASCLLACKNNGSENKTNQNSVDTIHQNTNSNTSETNVVYTKLNNYFVKNTVTQLEQSKIESEEQFNQVFGMAPVMGNNGKPTWVDFSSQFVIAVVLPETDIETELTPVSLQKNEAGELVFTYKVSMGTKQTFTTRPFLAIAVAKDQTGTVVVKEQK